MSRTSPFAHLRSVAAASIAALALAACGGGESPEGEGATVTQQATEAAGTPGSEAEREAGPGEVLVAAEAGDEPAFDPDALAAEAGEITFRFRNPSESLHSFCVESGEGVALGCTSQFRDDAGVLRLRLEPGEHAFFCNVAEHREAGMEGSLSVE